MAIPLPLWTKEAVDRECAAAHAQYKRELDDLHGSYFVANRDLSGEHPLKAHDLASALPPGLDFLAEYLPEEGRHRHHLSGGSSQTLSPRART
jgi:hypothetical protein